MNLYPIEGDQRLPTPKFKVGDRVRITKKRSIFTKGYVPRWTEEVFTIQRVLNTQPRTYKIIDDNKDIVVGSFYEKEMQITHNEIFRIEKVIRRKGNSLFVKWKGHSDKFNSWVNKTDIVHLR